MKNHKGRVVDGAWLFGMVERGSSKFRVEVCKDNKRDRKTLFEMIQRHILPGTTIMSDCWKGYNGLEDAGYVHQTVNHSVNFVDPITGAHTQKIESMWRALKARLRRGGIRHQDLPVHFAEFIYMREKRPNVFESLINDISKQWQC